MSRPFDRVRCVRLRSHAGISQYGVLGKSLSHIHLGIEEHLIRHNEDDTGIPRVRLRHLDEGTKDYTTSYSYGKAKSEPVTFS